MREPVIINDLRLPLGHQRADLNSLIARRAGRPAASIGPDSYRIIRLSVDARHKSAIILQYSVELDPAPLLLTGVAGLLPAAALRPANQVLRNSAMRPIVVGAGPAGLFAALFLALAGMRPILLERGRPVEERQIDVARFWQTGQLNPASNVQFGEGGAGTFSDGKLTTGIRDPRCRAVLEELVLAGAPQEILYLTRPHVGTDHLQRIVCRLRQKILHMDGEILFNTCLTGLLTDTKNQLTGLAFRQTLPDGSSIVQERLASQLILAVGHSARDTFEWLSGLPVVLEPKPFSLGLRIEHLQSLVNAAQYGGQAGHPQLPPAEYKMACHLTSGRSVYTFCMCPGGQVVASASEAGGVVTNGMSHFARDQANANSALLVGVVPGDFPEPGPLGGMHWQQQLERQAYAAGGGSYRAPAQLLGSFLSGSTNLPASHLVEGESPEPTYQPGVTWCDLADILPPMVRSALQEAIPLLGHKLRGFARTDSILTGIESRSSSPLRICRDDRMQASLNGLYPCGEGAGYAGGIMSAAVDGLRSAEAVCLQSRR